MLAITLESSATLRSLAEHIDARGEHVRFTLYSVDVRPEQQYLTSKRLTIGSFVRFQDNQLVLLEENRQRREWRCCRIEVVLQQLGHGATSCRQPSEIRVAQCDTLGKVIGDESVFVFNQFDQIAQMILTATYMKHWMPRFTKGHHRILFRCNPYDHFQLC